MTKYEEDVLISIIGYLLIGGSMLIFSLILYLFGVLH